MEPQSQPSQFEAILHSRTSAQRSLLETIADKMRERLESGARSLNQLGNHPPVLRARIACEILMNMSRELGADYTPDELSRVRTPHLRHEFAESVATFRSAFSLHAEVLHGFRETDPEFVFDYLLLRELFFGRLPVVASDLKDSLAAFSESNPAEGAKAMPPSVNPSFRGVRKAIEKALEAGPFFIVTGDKSDTVVKYLLQPNGWVREDSAGWVPTAELYRTLVWLPRTGMDMVRFNSSAGVFACDALIPGIRETELPKLEELLRRVYVELHAAEHFTQPGRCYPCRADAPPGTIEVRKGRGSEDNSIAFYPAGVLERSARDRFEADHENAPLLELITIRLNAKLRDLDMKHIKAKRGGLSTIDLVTSDKGDALREIRKHFLRSREYLVFIGDRIALNGNDVEAIDVADVSIQVGNEWDAQLFAGGHRMLLRSKQNASEGGAAEFIRAATRVRRLGLTGILQSEREASDSLGGNGVVSGPAAISGSLPPRQLSAEEVQTLVGAARTIVDQLLELGEGKPTEKARALAKALEQTLAQVPDSEEAFAGRTLDRLETLLLKRVVGGTRPVLASDLKDTIAVFDSTAVEWFPGAREAFRAALQDGPYFLMTGDSLQNLRDQFLLPAKIVERSDGHLTSELPGNYNLHLITRTGLDRVVFDFSVGELRREPLVPGISHAQVDSIADVLRQTAELYRCPELFKAFRIDPTRPAGYVDVRGLEYPGDSASFAFFPAGVLLKEERPAFRKQMMGNESFRIMIAHIREELRRLGHENVLTQQGGISTIDLTTTTKGTALAQLRRQFLGPRDFLVYMGDTVTQRGNDGSTIGVAEITVQLGAERDASLAPPPGCHHIHSSVHARDGGAAIIMQQVVRARRLSFSGLWNQTLPA